MLIIIRVYSLCNKRKVHSNIPACNRENWCNYQMYEIMLSKLYMQCVPV